MATAIAEIKGLRLGAYTLQEEIGRGDYSIVCKATTTRGDDVAIRRILVRRKLDDGQQQLEKVRSLPRHANVVRVLDFYSHVDLPRVYLVTNYLILQDLNQFLIPKRISDIEKLILMLDIVAGLSHLHEHEIIHGDLKPASIYIAPYSERSRCLLADYGLYKIQVHGSKLSRARKLGKVFRAPEILEEKKWSTASDIFSLGQVMFSMAAEIVYKDEDCRYLVPMIRDGEEVHALGEILKKDGFSQIISAQMGKLNVLSEVVTFMLLPNPAERPEIDFVKTEVGEILEAFHARGVPEADLQDLLARFAKAT